MVPQQPIEGGYYFLVLQLGNLILRKVKYLKQGHTASFEPRLI